MQKVDIQALDGFSDDRGRIQDLLVEPIDSVTRIFTKRNAVRGNHYHRKTTQFTYVVHGRLLVATQDPDEEIVKEFLEAGEMIVNPPNERHAWQAIFPTLVLVFTRGPRSGDQYESDTFRLSEEERLIK